MKISHLIVFCILTWSCSNQTNSDSRNTGFQITETTVSKAHLDSLRKKHQQQKDSIIFEDSIYTVRSTCHGEWGGSIWFTKKETGVEYSCSATCPVIVNKIDGSYIVTTTLAHGSGFSEFIQIRNPDLMEIFELPEPKELNEDGTPVYYVTDFESQSNEGTITLVDTIGILTLSSFEYQNELFHVTTDFKSTYISSVSNGKLELIDTLSNRSIWTYEPETFKTENGHNITFFWKDNSKGLVDIWENKIELKMIE